MAYGEAWNLMVKGIDEAIGTFDASVREAELEYDKQV